LDLSLLSVVGLFRGSLARLLRSGHPGRRVLRAVAHLLEGEDAEEPASWDARGRAPFVYHLARALGLLAADAGHLRVDGARAAAYFLASAPDRVRQRVRAWRNVTAWSELADLPGLEIDQGARARSHGAPDNTQAARARTRVYDAVAALPRGDWTPVSAVVEALADATLLFPAETGPYYPGVATRRRPAARVPRRSHAPVVEQAFVVRSLEILAELDAVTLDEDAGVQRVRPSAAGLYALGTASRPEVRPHTGGELVVQPTFEVVVLSQRADVSLVFTLERFARRTGPGPGTTYRLDEESVYRAVREGLEIPSLLEFLEAHASSGVPGSVRFALQDWARRQDRIRVLRHGSLIEFANAASLDAHLVAMDLESTGARRVGERWILVPAGERREVTRCLGQNYFTDLDYAGTLPPCLEVSAGLDVHVAPERSRLDIEWLLGRFAERHDGRWRISPESLASAAASGLPLPQIQELLEELAVGGAPPELRVLADAAAGALGGFGLGSACVLVTEEPGDLARLLELDAVSERVSRVAAAGVALVPPEHEAELRRLLEGLGVREDDALVHATSAAAAPEVGRLSADQVKTQLDRCITEGREAVIRFDPGARRPLQDIRVEPVRVERRNGVAYLLARQRGRDDVRRFSLNFVSGVRLLGKHPG